MAILGVKLIPTQRVFVKMDCEGAEVDIIPSLFDWLVDAGPERRPIMFVSIHPQPTLEQRIEISKVFNLYKYFAIIQGADAPQAVVPRLGLSNEMCEEGIRLRTTDSTPFDSTRIVPWHDYLLTDDSSFSKSLCGDPLE